MRAQRGHEKKAKEAASNEPREEIEIHHDSLQFLTRLDDNNDNELMKLDHNWLLWAGGGGPIYVQYNELVGHLFIRKLQLGK